MSIPTMTEAQKLAVDFDQEANLLISAAAGSGKTTTLTERIVKRMKEGRLHPSRLLVITFTELAAKDLKVKISGRLRLEAEQLANEEEKRSIDPLIDELNLAQISTIHAFCNQVLSAYLPAFSDPEGHAYLEPGYRILDSREEEKLRDQAMDQVLSLLYSQLDALDAGQQASPDSPLPRKADLDQPGPYVLTGQDRTWAQWLTDFRSISQAYSPDLNDDSLRQALTRMLEQLRNLPRYRELVKASLDRLFERSDDFPAADDPAALYWWGLYEESLDRANQALNQLTRTDFWREDLPQSKTKSDKDLFQLIAMMKEVTHALSTLSGHDPAHWDAVSEVGRQIRDFPLPRLTGSRSTSDHSRQRDASIMTILREVLPLAALISDRFKRPKRIADASIGYPPVFSAPVQTMRQALARAAGPAARFMETLLLVDDQFQKSRFQLNAIQFSDIEHGALALLDQEEIRADYLEKYQEIYIDEYQDTSSIQDALVRRISDRNLLMVGDIKQSIYRFRYANPSLFAGYEANSCLVFAGQTPPPLGPQESGYLALLNRCFRTRPTIIDFINDFFQSFLTRESGEIDYDESQKLIADQEKWQAYDDQDQGQWPTGVFLDVATSLKGIPEDDGEEKEEKDPDQPSLASLLPEDLPLTATSQEALMAARIIRDLVERGVAYDQIAILLPTNNHCRVYEESLALCGIPVTSRSGRLFPDSLVFRQVEALLSVLDNPRQDIPLLSFMMGPFAPDPWTGEELLTLANWEESRLDDNPDKSSKRRLTFHDKFFSLAQTDDQALSQKAQGLAARIDRWRFLAQELGHSDLLDLIFAECNYHEYLARSRFGESQMAELDRLMDLLAKEDPLGLTGPRRALENLRLTMEEGPAEGTSDKVLLPGAVRVLTRHSSKGLEFDYVILGCLNPRAGRQEGRQTLLFTEEEGLSSASIDQEGLEVINNPLHEASRVAEADRERAESWRLLYVAMTRAIHGLYLLFPLDQAQMADKEAFRSVIEESRWASRHLSHAQRRQGAILPASFSRRLKTDAELLLAYMAVRYPSFIDKLAETQAGQGEDGSLEPGDFPPLFSNVRVQTWENLVRRIFSPPPLDPKEEEVEAAPSDSQIEGPSPLQLLQGEIPYQEAALAPSKVTVTEMQRLGFDLSSGLADEATDPEDLHTLIPLDDPQDQESLEKEILPRIIKAEMPLTMRAGDSARLNKGLELGSILHTILRFLDLAELSSCPPQDCLSLYRAQLEDMVSRDIIKAYEMDLAWQLAGETVRWAQSDLASRLLKVERSTGRVYREMPFTLALPSKSLSSQLPEGEITLVQGMIDLWFVEDDGQAILIDFKTDRLPKEDSDRLLRARYQIQIDAYADAIERATGRTVKERIIWVLREGRPLAM